MSASAVESAVDIRLAEVLRELRELVKADYYTDIFAPPLKYEKHLNEKEGLMPTTSHDCWEVADAVMSVSRRVLLRGKPGTGKTYHAVNSALPDGQKVYQITMTEETPAAEIRGHYTVKGGDYVWSDGPAIMAWREGARLVINEIDRASEDCLSLMYALLDDPEFAQLTLPTGETVRPAKGFQVIATMNGRPDDLPDALQDRLPVDIEITGVNPEALERLPEDLREPALNTALAKSDARGVSIRMWLEFAHLRESLPAALREDQNSLEIAAQAVFGDNYRDALNALTISKAASDPQDMSGYIFTDADKLYIEELASWWDLYKTDPTDLWLNNMVIIAQSHPDATVVTEWRGVEGPDRVQLRRPDGSWTTIPALIGA